MTSMAALKTATLLAMALALGTGCASLVSTQQVTDGPTNPDEWTAKNATDSDTVAEKGIQPEVGRMELSRDWGELGQPFEADVRITDNLEHQRQVSISKLPPGLRYDAKRSAIVGVPKKTGFFAVTVAVRKQVEERPFRYAKPSDRWFTQDFELRIYKPLVD